MTRAVADQRSAYWRLALIAGLIAGTVDIAAAALINRVSPVVILHVIARGLLGKPAMTGGAPTAVLGLVLQWAMAIIIAALFGAAARVSRLRQALWALWGALGGGIIFVVMEFVVVPLSAIHKFPKFTVLSLFENIAAMIVFGLIVAFVMRRVMSPSQA